MLAKNVPSNDQYYKSNSWEYFDVSDVATLHKKLSKHLICDVLGQLIFILRSKIWLGCRRDLGSF